MSTAQDKYDIPKDVLAAVKVKAFAEALGVKERQVRYWCEIGILEYRQFANSGARYIPTSEAARLESLGWPVDWERFLRDSGPGQNG
jgi:hypothetical protein